MDSHALPRADVTAIGNACGITESLSAVGVKLQTDARFDREIIGRMGERFYRDVLAPAIVTARPRGERDEAIEA